MTIGSNRRADRTNRIVLTVIGSIAVIAAGSGILYSYLAPAPSLALIDPDRRSWLLDHAMALAIGAAVVIIGFAAALVMWLRHQIQPIPEAGNVTMARSDHGTTTLSSRALTDAVTADLVELRGVVAATSRIRASDADTIDVLLDVDDTAQLDRVANEARTVVLARARHATGRGTLTLAIECRPIASPAAPRAA